MNLGSHHLAAGSWHPMMGGLTRPLPSGWISFTLSRPGLRFPPPKKKTRNMLNDHMSVFLKVTQWFFMIVLGLQRNPLTFIFLLRFVLRSAANSLLVSGESRLTQKKHHCWHCSACFFLWIQLLPSHAGRYDHPAAERTWPVAARANFFSPGVRVSALGWGGQILEVRDTCWEKAFLQELFSVNDLVPKDRVFGTMILVQNSKEVYMQTFDYSRLTKHHQAPSSNSGLIIYNMVPPFREDSWILNHPKWDWKK